MTNDESAGDILRQLREQQVRSWQLGQPLKVELLSDSQPTARDLPPDCLLDLIYGEVLLREEAGERPTEDEYVTRFPQLADSIRRQFAVHAAWSLDGSDNIRRAEPPLPAISRYEMLEQIGRGGASVVYRALDRHLQRIVAIKVLRDGILADDTSRERFRAEAEAVAKLQHPHIVQIHDYGEADGFQYLALEYLADGTLESWQKSPHTFHEIAAMMETIADAVGFAHSQGIVHRDLKPSNVLLAGDSPKIADFGLAKQIFADSNLTQSAAILGTCMYMSPEQAWGKAREVGPATDIHAIGVMLYESLVGQTPFGDDTLAKTLDRVRFETAPSPQVMRSDVPLSLAAICLRCLAKSPSDRYANGSELAADLRRFRENSTSAAQHWFARRTGNPRRYRVQERLAIAAAIAMVVAAIGTFAAFRKDGRTSPQPSGFPPPTRTDPQVFALLVGVRSYQFGKDRISLEYTEADVDELARLLLKKGVQRKNIRLLTQWGEADNPALAPTADNIRRQFREFLSDCVAGDTVWVALTGMGGESGTEGVYCYLPADVQLDRRSTVLPLPDLYELLSQCDAGQKLLIIDTCQTTTLPDFGLKNPTPPPGVAALFACSRAEASYEHADLRHGVFSYQVIKGIEGAADADHDGTTTIGELHEYASGNVRDFVESHWRGKSQNPRLEASLDRKTGVLPPPPQSGHP
jgi:serine/threonine protein kinase